MKNTISTLIVILLANMAVFAQAKPSQPKIGELPIGKVLTWHTEGDQKQLFVQRSTDGVYYTTVGKVQPQDTIKKNFYTYLDASLSPAKVYYRIAQATHETGIQYSEATFYSSAAPNMISLKRISNTHVDKMVIVEFESSTNAEGMYSITTDIQNHKFTVLERPFPIMRGRNVLPIKVAFLDPGFYQVNMKMGEETEKFSFVKEKSTDSKPGAVVAKKNN